MPSKHPHSEFLGWMVQLLQTTDPLVVYTEEWLVPTLHQLAVGRHIGFTPPWFHLQNGSRTAANTRYVTANLSQSMVASRCPPAPRWPGTPWRPGLTWPSLHLGGQVLPGDLAGPAGHGQGGCLTQGDQESKCLFDKKGGAFNAVNTPTIVSTKCDSRSENAFCTHLSEGCFYSFTKSNEKRRVLGYLQ